jgi:multicomponent Na+:H+ antiporter subunit D
METHLPILPIIVPLMSAPFCLLLRKRQLVMGFAMTVSWVVFALAVRLVLRVLHTGTVSYDLGGWAEPWGIVYRVDLLSAFVVFFVSGIGAVVFTFAPRSIDREIPRDRHYLFIAMCLLCLTGLLGISITGDLFNLFVFLEISALSSYTLISLGESRRALTSAFQYLVMGTIGATFILIGIGLMYMMTGTLNMADMAERIRPVIGTRTILVAFAFLTVGISLKMALFPLHIWLPNAYTYAPSVVTALLAATATKVAVYILLRFTFTIFGVHFAFESIHLGAILQPLSLLAIFVASLVAIFQHNIKRMLAYSSLAQIGYMVLGISFATTTGLTAGIVHLFNHAMTKGGMFLAMGCIVWRLGSVELRDLRGAGRRMPVTMALWVLGGLSLIGVPATAGFISKWYLIRTALEAGRWPVAALVLISSLLAVVYVWRVVETAYFKEPPDGSARRAEAPLSMLVPTGVLVGAALVFGLWTGGSVGLAQRAATVILSGIR